MICILISQSTISYQIIQGFTFCTRREVLDTAYVIKFVGELFTRCILMYGIMD
jgi:hypothetical protein